MPQLVGSKKCRRKSNFIQQSGMFLKRNLKSYMNLQQSLVITAIAIFWNQKKRRMRTQIKVSGNKKFDNINRNNVH